VADFNDCQALYSDVQRSLDLQQGPLLRALLVDAAGRQRLLLAIHHLVVDGVSWRAAGRPASAVSATLPPRPTPWATGRTPGQLCRQRFAARRTGLVASQLGSVRRELPCDHPQGGNLHRHAHSLAIAEQTRQLLQQAPAAYHTQVNDLLLTALARPVPLEW
jgi:hypothetical protein